MKIQTFRCSTVQEAIQKVRETLGPEASVLHIRNLPVDKKHSRRTVEIDASRDIVVPSRFEAPADKDVILSFSDVQHKTVPTETGVEQLSTSLHPTCPQIEAYITRLTESGFSPEYARESTEHCFHPSLTLQEFEASLVLRLAGKIPTGNQLVPKDGQTVVIALHHNQGSASSILSGLATQYSLQLESPSAGQVGFLISNPSSNQDLPELLQTAEKLDAAFEVVSVPEAIRPALQRMQNCSVVFTDIRSAEQSHRQLLQLEPHINYIHLADNATTSTMQSQLAHFLGMEIASATGVILDLPSSPGRQRFGGEVLELFSSWNVPISYLQHNPSSQLGQAGLQPATGEAIVHHFLPALLAERGCHGPVDEQPPEGLRVFQPRNIQVV